MTDGGWTTRLRSVALLFSTSLALFTTACTAQADPTTTTTAAIAAVDTVPDPTTTTTTTAPAQDTSSVDICGRGTIREPGTTYIASCFLTPLAFVPEAEGWRSSRATLEAVEGLWVAPGEREPAIRYAALAYQPDDTPAEVVASVLAKVAVNSLSPVVGDDSVSVDVDTTPVAAFGRAIASSTLRPPCILAVGANPDTSSWIAPS